MISIRPSDQRGHADHGWLRTRHTFSFGDYRDPGHMHFRSLRVINEDVVAPGQGFGMHPHRDMEILTWVVSGALKHADSMGHSETIRPGDIQHMTAGTGVLHSEFNPSDSEPVHLLQIWIMPAERGLQPGYSQRHFDVASRTNRLQRLASGDDDEHAIRINQDVTLYASVLDRGRTVEHALQAGRHAWIQVIRGSLQINGQRLNEGDGAGVTDESNLRIDAASDSCEFLLFDLA